MGRIIPIKTFAAIAAVCVLSACGGGSPKPVPKLTENFRSSLGTVGVITSGPAVGGKVDGPVGVPGQAVVGVLEGGAVGTVSGLGAGALLGLACGPGAIFCVPVLVLGGGIVGLVGGSTYGGISKGRNAIPDSIASQIQTALSGAISDRDLQADLRQRVLQHPASTAMGVDIGVGAIVPVASPDYAAFTSRGIGTVLELSLTQLTFTGAGGRNPTLTLVVAARARLIRIGDGRVLWTVEEVKYQSPAAEFALWTARDAGLLKSEIDNGLEMVARQIDEALFLAPAAGLRAL